MDFRNDIAQYMGEKRLNHSLSVREECIRLGERFGLDEKTISDLSVAGYFHDITKERTLDEQLELCRHFGIEYSEDDLMAPKLFHAKTGADLAREKYPELVNDNVFRYILSHTTGKADMTIGEKLVYLADYIEPTRKFGDCVKLREFFYSFDKKKGLYEHLDETLILSFDMTIADLIADGKLIDRNTVSARNSLIINRKKAEQ